MNSSDKLKKTLVYSDVQRAGLTSRYIGRTGGVVTMTAVPDTQRVWGDERLMLHVSINSKGGGTTEVALRIGKLDYEALIEGMATTDHEYTVKLLANMLNRLIQERPKSDFEGTEGVSSEEAGRNWGQTP